MKLNDYIQMVLDDSTAEPGTFIEFDVGVYAADGEIRVDCSSQNRIKFKIKKIV